MPDKRRHRGAHPLDKKLFNEGTSTTLRNAVEDLSWLIGRGYSQNAALKIVGDKHGLQKRQRSALSRSACSDQARSDRQAKRLSLGDVEGQVLVIDGFNCLITVEAALSGGLIIGGRDSASRDLASVHGSYRRVEETVGALAALSNVITEACPSSVYWYLDRPVSNSGVLASMIRELDSSYQVELVFNPDRSLVTDKSWVVASSDAWVIDMCSNWFDLTGAAIASLKTPPWKLDLAPAVVTQS